MHPSLLLATFREREGAKGEWHSSAQDPNTGDSDNFLFHQDQNKYWQKTSRVFTGPAWLLFGIPGIGRSNGVPSGPSFPRFSSLMTSRNLSPWPLLTPPDMLIHTEYLLHNPPSLHLSPAVFLYPFLFLLREKASAFDSWLAPVVMLLLVWHKKFTTKYHWRLMNTDLHSWGRIMQDFQGCQPLIATQKWPLSLICDEKGQLRLLKQHFGTQLLTHCGPGP